MVALAKTIDYNATKPRAVRATSCQSNAIVRGCSFLEGTPMGYSCTQKAALVLDALMVQLQARSDRDDLGSNVWTYQDREWFYEIGREQADGAITGSVYFIYDDGQTVSRRRHFRINADGRIIEWPGTDYRIRWTAYQAGMAEYQRIHGIAFMVI
jgi:hypothetical protein